MLRNRLLQRGVEDGVKTGDQSVDLVFPTRSDWTFVITYRPDKQRGNLKSDLQLACPSSMKTIFAALFCILLCAANATAQSTVEAGKAKSVDVSLGYSYVSQPVSSSDRLGLNGVDASATIGLIPHFGIMADLGYARASHALGTPSHSDVLSYLGGPVFYPVVQHKLDPYVHALFGGARVSSPVPVTGGFLIGGYASGFAWAVGGGVDYHVTQSIALRAGLDYMRTSYFGPTLAMQGENNFRAIAAVVYSFGTRERKRR